MTDIEQAMSIEATDADTGFTPQNIADAEWLWAHLPVGPTRFHDRPTHERALVCHTAQRFRQQAVAAEVAQIVAWLRQTADSYSFGTYERCSEMRSYWQSAANAIERGQYKPKETAGE